MVTTLPLDSFHTAHLEVGAGYGLLVCPPAGTDVWLGRESVHGAAWGDVLRRLSTLGWTPRRDGSGLLRYVGRAEDGRLVVEAEALNGCRTVGQDVWEALCEAAGLVLDGPRPRA